MKSCPCKKPRSACDWNLLSHLRILNEIHPDQYEIFTTNIETGNVKAIRLKDRFKIVGGVIIEKFKIK